MTTPYIPAAPLQNTARSMYRSLVSVQRLTPVLGADGVMQVSWSQVTDQLDPYLGATGQLLCRLDVGFIRRGIDQPMPLVAGRTPDRVALAFFDCIADATGRPLIKAGDRLVCIQGPIFGTWDIRTVPDVAQDYLGAHHIETQVVEVAQNLKPGSMTPWPGSPP